ncbi:DUF6221 family protein [Streptomyces sp. NBC_01214]|uniref:DUF6221 family protein n=1 Tax=Streptomyces sp. NBC_01214 TaxID=2903777 RepID=UPI00224F140D|nr:DUF6221 family protein [Streptomyces sp. NBC_01214]MCX4801770.1 DUF6221 family protein [Streptomyces sp. NBC_01214]
MFDDLGHNGVMDDLVQFLRDRLDEDEQAAQQAIACEFLTSGQWLARGPYGDDDRFGNMQSEQNEQIIEDGLLWGTVAHIARHDPARVLAEVDAKRRLLAIHRRFVDEPGQACLGCAGGIEWEACPVVRLLALPYADHPYFREEWRP